MKTHEAVRQGGKNIFEDLKLPDAEELNAKAQIAYRICGILEERKLTQKEAADLIDKRYPVYAEADVTVVSRDVPQEHVATDVLEAVLAFLGGPLD